MTNLSFHVGDDEADAVQRCADQPLTDDEMAIGRIADWGVAEDWSDWAVAAR